MAAEETKSVAEKISRLSWFLQQATDEIKKVALDEKDKSFQMALICLATESKQYAHEWSCQLNAIDGDHFWETQTHSSDDIIWNNTPIADAEKYFEKEYSAVIDESQDYPYVKAMMNYQLRGIRGGFMKLRLLQHVS